MSDHSELLKEARTGADALADRCHVTAATMIRDLANIVEAYDKADSECAAACVTCDEVIRRVTLALTSGCPLHPESALGSNLDAAGHLARMAVENHEKAKGGGA